MKIKIYTTPTCLYSTKAKRLLKQRKLPFEEITLMKEGEARLEMIELSGQMATPVIVIDGEVRVGFDEPVLKDFLKKKKAEARKIKS
jgi:glutaredoxin